MLVTSRASLAQRQSSGIVNRRCQSNSDRGLHTTEVYLSNHKRANSVVNDNTPTILSRTALIAASIFAFVFGVYVATLHPFFPIGDSGEFVVAAKTLGVSHPPGSPFYALLSYLSAHMPVGNLVTRLNILSALFGALTAMCAFFFVYEVTKRYIPSVFAGILLAITHIFWLYAIIPEVYSLSIFLNITMLYWYVIWMRSHKQMHINLAALFAGLSLSVHYINIISIILIFTFALYEYKTIYSSQKLLHIFGYFFIGLTPILTIPLAASHHAFGNWGGIYAISDFISFILRTDFSIIGQSESFSYPLWLAFKEQIPYWGTAMYSSIGPSIALLLPVLLVKRPKLRVLTLIVANALLMGPILTLFESYPLTTPYPDVALNHMRLMQQVHIFALPYLCILIGLGLAAMQEKILDIKTNTNKSAIYIAGILLLAALLSVTFWVNYQKIASARNSVFKHYGENILRSVHRPSIVITGTEESNILSYLYEIEGNKKQETRLITFSLMQNTAYVNELKRRYPDVSFPFDHVEIGQKLDSFYSNNAKKFDIVFAPLDDQARQSISDSFDLIPYGLTIKLVPKPRVIDPITYTAENKQDYLQFIGLNAIEQRLYDDEATNEVLMSYARAFSNIAIMSKKLGDTQTALYFLQKANTVQSGYTTAYHLAASIYLDRKDLTRAAGEYVKLLTIRPKEISALRNLALIYSQQNNQKQAMLFAQRYLKEAVTDDQRREAQSILSNLMAKTIQ